MPGRQGPKGHAYWDELELYWQGYLEAYGRFLKARDGSLEQRRARAEMRREMSLRMALEGLELPPE